MKDDTEATEARPNDRRNLVGIEITREFDVLEKEWTSNIYFKVYVAVKDSGLLAAMPDREWKTLSALACHMDREGQCYPSLAHLARVLGVSVSTASERVDALARFRFQGKPVLLKKRQVRMTERGPRFASNLYTLLPISQVGIFDKQPK